uniref:Putative head-tail joining protein n=1 Tax=viral metagenome TaxID=1070528 RepID=A0A6M3IPF3_9ZZZZ
MLANLLKARVQLVQKSITQGVLGQTVTYVPIQYKYAQVKPLSASARVQYQQLNSVVTHEVTLRGEVTVDLGEYQIKWKDKTLEPVGPTRLVNGNTIVAVKEL